jgi:hypothetical protein
MHNRTHDINSAQQLAMPVQQMGFIHRLSTAVGRDGVYPQVIHTVVHSQKKTLHLTGFLIDAIL